jgi:hypothetical protein
MLGKIKFNGREKMSTTIDITGMDKAEILAALYNGSRPLGMGMLHFTPEDMGKNEAHELLNETTSFDYLKGRVMKISLKGDELYTGLYNRDNGEGAAERIIQRIKNQE